MLGFTVVLPNLPSRPFTFENWYNSLVLELVSAIATLIAGPLSDRVLEPAMQSETILSSLFAPIFGNGAGAGMALLYVCCAIAMFLVGAVGDRLPQLRQLEDRVLERSRRSV
ncbi:MAG: hypothetical protein QNJ72_18385 [Pleurocapsa sp. MO_226.B13]|nr:hypothetical protein [Pleurocapsa sp. MO_226.B13]